MLTIRARLCLSYAALVAGCGAVLITLVYLYMRYVPSYELPTAPATELDPTDLGLDQVQPAHALEIRTVDDFFENLVIASLIALGILIILGGIVGWVMAGRIIRPLAAINAGANRAASGDLDHRIGLEGPHDEIRDLSATFDRMLASLEHAFESQQRFAANASHELRSPLTTVKTMIDVTLSDPDVDPGELRALAERIRDVNQSNIDTVEALLDLASASNARLVPERIDVTALIDEVAAELTAELEASELTLTTRTAEAWAFGSPILLRQALSNLLRNASRHNHLGGHIIVRTLMSPTATHVTVSNTGATISQETVAQLTEPFARAHGRTLTRGSGHGLGLAIVAAIARAHEGALTLTPNSDGGLTAHLDLPISQTDPVSR
ncbi:two-component sensor histidine kinase [Acrocarpospora pleiomorpha]|uniref:histidine kinase n=1 Tax=Acrocarpospora pleiomorpha TaxID=90975 RepID=A0A5M3XBF4_9ACTN|nr:two-component sensor histidine kinase [Acrocarpospora pleiomorpha]